MAFCLNNNIIKIIYENIDIGRNSFLQNIRNKALLEAILYIINFTLNKQSLVKYVGKINKFNLPFYAIQMLTNGYLLVSSGKGLLKVFDSNNNFSCIKKLSSMHVDSIYSILVLQDGNIITRSLDALTLWEQDTFKYKTLKGHKSSIWSVIQLDNGYIVSSALDNTVFLWNKEICINIKFVDVSITVLKLLSNKRFLGSSSFDITVFGYNLNIITKVVKDTRRQPSVFEFDKSLIVCYEKYLLSVYDIQLNHLENITIDKDCVEFIKLNNKDIISVCKNTIVVWDVDKDYKKQVFQFGCNFIKAISFDENCFFITTSDDNKCKLWYYHNEPRLIKTFEGVDRDVQVVGDYLITASSDYTCQIYKLNR
jgi:WD40 repeat protein